MGDKDRARAHIDHLSRRTVVNNQWKKNQVHIDIRLGEKDGQQIISL